MLPAPMAAARCGRSYQEVDGIPTIDSLPLHEARANSATGRRAALLQEYMGYIQRVAPGQAGKLEPEEGETTQAVRRRLASRRRKLWGRVWRSAALPTPSTSGRREVGDVAGPARSRLRSPPAAPPRPNRVHVH